MRKAGLLAFLAIVSGFSPAAADPLYLTGEIGTFPVLLMLDQDGPRLNGWYYYLRNGKEIKLQGKIDTGNGEFTIDEFTLDGTRTGTFKGTAAKGEWHGTWQKAGDTQTLALNLKENTDTLKDLTTQVDCTARLPDRKYGFIAATTLHLTAAKGEVKRFSMTLTSPFKDERLDCKINRSDLVQVNSDAGLLLKAKDNVESATHTCAIRILGTASHFYVSVDDCKAANNDHWFCGGHATWTDLIVDRKRGTCIRKE